MVMLLGCLVFVLFFIPDFATLSSPLFICRVWFAARFE